MEKKQVQSFDVKRKKKNQQLDVVHELAAASGLRRMKLADQRIAWTKTEVNCVDDISSTV